MAARAAPLLGELPKPLSLRRNFAWTVLAGCVRGASRWGIVLVLAHLGNLEMIGQVALAYAVCAPVSGLMNLGLRVALVTDAKHEYPFADYLGLRLITAGIAMLVVVGTTLVMGYETQLALVILVVGLGNVFESISELFHGLLQQRERMDSIAIALMIRGPLNLVFLAVAVYLTGSILWGIVGFPLAWAVTLLACDIPNGARMVKGSTPQAGASSAARAGIGGLRPRWNPRSLVRLAWIGLPLGVVTMMVMLIENVPRYMIDYHLGKPALGVFASIIYLMMVGTMVVNGLGQSASPRLAKHYARGDRPAFCRLLGKLLGVALCLGGGGAMLMVLFGGRVLQLLYGAEFTRYADLAVYLMIAAAIMYLNGPLSKAVEAMRHFKMNMVVRTTSGLVLLVLLPGLLGAHGLKGVAGAIAISAAVSVLMYAGTAYWGIRRTEEATAQGVAAALT